MSILLKRLLIKTIVTVCFCIVAAIVLLVNGAKFVDRRKMTFDISSITRIEIVDGSNGNTIDIFEAEQIQALVNQYNVSEFQRRQSSIDTTGWSYRLSFFQDNIITTQITIINTERISFQGYFYNIKSGTIDIEYYKGLLSSP